MFNFLIADNLLVVQLTLQNSSLNIKQRHLKEAINKMRRR